MAYREIRTRKDPILRQIAKPVTNYGKWLKKLLDDMEETMLLSDGAGLAAPQVGISKRIITVLAEEGVLRLVNPVIVEAEGEKYDLEGCLSVPEFIGKVKRAERVVVKANDENGNEITVKGDGLIAVALQHETDHLDGILFIDKAKEIYNNDPVPSVEPMEFEEM
ncbi:peptide deformylase [Clostridium sp. 'deep sea']|uniref:peptide deformylase n=1 Tax=Clostridium sp. 'deep sea' TaxID=2779445 RepID=UPI001896A262|nr:peptide deformylase [Clostridium sp. 'deep sea']QOR36192.1 peptide deformylase [Clostridium sp. 'deep sea']